MLGVTSEQFEIRILEMDCLGCQELIVSLILDAWRKLCSFWLFVTSGGAR